MEIKIIERITHSDFTNWFEEVTTFLEGINCTDFLDNLVGLSQMQQKEKVSMLQGYLLNLLSNEFKYANWSSENKDFSLGRDSIDILGQKGEEIIVIELDKWRADQAAKKMVSRTSIFIETHLSYISLCYGGTKKMNKKECMKYFKFISKIFERLEFQFCGMIIEK